MRADALLFGETQNRVVITVAPADAGRVLKQASLLGVPAARIGVVGGDALVVRTADGEWSAPLQPLHDAWWNSIARAMAAE
jgi:phosphoribosylformylglycinamidine synthase